MKGQIGYCRQIRSLCVHPYCLTMIVFLFVLSACVCVCRSVICFLKSTVSQSVTLHTRTWLPCSRGAPKEIRPTSSSLLVRMCVCLYVLKCIPCTDIFVCAMPPAPSQVGGSSMLAPHPALPPNHLQVLSHKFQMSKML